MFKIVATGSDGNCEVYNTHIAIDMGIIYSQIKPYLNTLQIVLLTHLHSDHFNEATIKRIAFERPTLRFAIGEHMIEKMQGIKNVDVCEFGKWYNYGLFKICPVMLYHDVTNIGWRIFINKPNNKYYKIFRATDTAHLEGIIAKDYDLYCLESNYDEETVFDSIASKEAKGEFCYQKGAVNSHLSEQQARDFFYKNKSKTSALIRLHESKTK